MLRFAIKVVVSGLQSRLSGDERRFFIEWLLVTSAALFCLTLFLWMHLTDPLGHLIYDQVHRMQPEKPSRDIVIIAVDDDSLDRLGGWPLRRGFYADLLKRLAVPDGRPKAVGFDILFYDPSPDDAVFAEQLRHHRAFLAMEPTVDESGLPTAGRFPLPGLAEAATGLVHITASYENDGFMRGAELVRGGMPHLALAVSDKLELLSTQGGAYRRFHLVDPQRGFQTFSLADVLTGQVPVTAFKDKYILIGATAPSLGDYHPTIYSGRISAGMPGVELHANLLNGILQDNLVKPSPFGAQLAISVIAVLAVAFGMFLVGPLAELFLAGLVVMLLMLFSFSSLSAFKWWFDPSAAYVVIALMKPAWAWRRADMIIGFLKERAASIESLASSKAALGGPALRGDTVLRYSGLLDRAIYLVSESVRLLGGILNESPNATLVSDLQGVIVLANDRMRTSIGGTLVMPGRPLMPLLGHLGFSPFQRLDELAGQMCPVTVEVEHGVDHYIFHAAMIRLGEDHAPLLLISLVDVTEVRRSQAQRDRALQFLSHDMRTPVAAIIALSRMGQTGDQENAAGIQRNADKLLELMDDFIFSIKAEASQYRLVEAMFESLLDEAVFQVRDSARLRDMPIGTESDGSLPFVLVDARLITRVIVNLLANAVRYGHPGCPILVRQSTLLDGGQSWVRCEVINQVGDPCSAWPDPAEVKGFGLGTEFIRTVVRKHGGRVYFNFPTRPGAQASVAIWLPVSG